MGDSGPTCERVQREREREMRIVRVDGKRSLCGGIVAHHESVGDSECARGHPERAVAALEQREEGGLARVVKPFER